MLRPRSPASARRSTVGVARDQPEPRSPPSLRTVSRTGANTGVCTTGQSRQITVNRGRRFSPSFDYPHFVEAVEEVASCCVVGVGGDSLPGAESERSGADGRGGRGVV